jgi:acyl phosphate:glycerol-3-phosphate acyltransferase
MDYLQIMLCTMGAYLIGALPTSRWYTKLRFGINIHEHGNGAASHLNIQHVIGPSAGWTVRILDIIKGLLAAKLAYFVHNEYGFFSEIEYPILMLSFGLAGILGHIFPAFSRYQGGKGFHIMLGVLTAVQPLAMAIAIGSAALIFLLFRYPHLAYVAGSLAVPVFVVMTRGKYGDMMVPMLVFSVALFAMLFFSHRQNLRDILQGRVAKASWRDSRPDYLRRR